MGALLGGLGACVSPNAVLEVAVHLKYDEEPPWGWAGASRTRMYVMFRPASGQGPSPCMFDAIWERESFDPEPVPVPEPGGCAASSEEPCVHRFSVVSERDDWDLCIRVGFCGPSEACQPGGDPDAFELRYELQHPFYLGKRTYWDLYVRDWSLPCQAPPPARSCAVQVDRCRIRGCADSADLPPEPTDPSAPMEPPEEGFFCFPGEGAGPAKHFCEL